MDSILITGANGYLGGIITKMIIENTEYGVLAVASSENKVTEMVKRMNIEHTDKISFLSNLDLIKTETKLENISGAIHLAFARRKRPAADIAESLKFSEQVFEKLAASGIDRVINMSSQGVYGSTDTFRTETTVPAPETHYTMAKYATEILFDYIMRDVVHHTNLRLDLVTQSQNVIQSLCNQAKAGKINLRGGKQYFSFIDGIDVGSAVVAMLKSDGDWDSIYNVGWNKKRYTLVEIANVIADTSEKCGLCRPEIILDEQDITLWAGMDSSKFIKKVDWKPTQSLSQTVTKMLMDLS